jgi:putative two-component system response regulator
MHDMKKRASILVVDDFKTNVEFLRDILESQYAILTAYNGEEALSIARSERPDLILLDVMMPGKDGYEVCRELKADARTAEIPIVFVTALGDEEDEARAFEAGGADFITKPVKLVVVKKRIKTQLELLGKMRDLEEEVARRTEEIEQTRQRIIDCLGKASEFRDNETGNHVLRMSMYSERIALAYGLDEREALRYRFVTPMHDVGKIGIRDSILLKPGRLEPAEFEEMKQHCVIGERILGSDGSLLLKMAATCAKSHHEKWDGSGYPLGLVGEDIPLVGRIAAVADVFDALTSERPYKEAWPIGRASAEIENSSGSHFDPAVVNAFAASLESILEIRERYLEA